MSVRLIVAMGGVSFNFGELLKSVEKAQEHAEITSHHSNFAESTEAVLNLVCTTCCKPCRSRTVLIFDSLTKSFLYEFESDFIGGCYKLLGLIACELHDYSILIIFSLLLYTL